MAVNYFGAVNCTRHALPSLLERRGQVIVLSSLSSFAPLLNRSAYNASKHALHGLFETLRMEVREQGVNVMLVSPGFTATDIRKNALVGDGSVAQANTALPFKVAAPADVAEAIYQGACRRKRQLILSNVDWQARLFARFFPRLFERWMVPRLSGVKPASARGKGTSVCDASALGFTAVADCAPVGRGGCRCEHCSTAVGSWLVRQSDSCGLRWC